MKKIRRNINLMIIPLLLLSFFAFSGFDCEEGGIELRVVGSGDFAGYFTKDGGQESSISCPGDNCSTRNGLSIFSKNLGTFKQVEISVRKESSSSVMDIYLYDKNGDVIQRITNAACEPQAGACTNSSSMSYTFTSGQR